MSALSDLRNLLPKGYVVDTSDSSSHAFVLDRERRRVRMPDGRALLIELRAIKGNEFRGLLRRAGVPPRRGGGR